MPQVDVKSNAMHTGIEMYIRKLKRFMERTGEAKRQREIAEGHTTKSEKNRRDKKAARKRQDKQDQKQLQFKMSLRKMRKRRSVAKAVDIQ